MTEMLNKEFSRKSFVKGGGVMFVGLSVGGAGVAGKAQAADSPFASNGPPDLAGRSTAFIAIHADNTVSVKTGRVELGQGSNMGLMMIAAEELDMDIGQMKFVTPRHERHAEHRRHVRLELDRERRPARPQRGGDREAGAARRSRRRSSACRSSSLTVSKGVVSGGGKSVTYGALIGDKLFNVPDGGGEHQPGRGAVEGRQRVHARRRSARAAGRHPGQGDGQARLRAEHPRAGDAPRPARPAARPGRLRRRHDAEDRLGRRELDQAHRRRARSCAGTTSSASSASRSTRSIQAAAQLKVKYADPPKIASSGNLWKSMRDFDAAGQAPARIAATRATSTAHFASAAVKVSGDATSTSTTATCRSARPPRSRT